MRSRPEIVESLAGIAVFALLGAALTGCCGPEKPPAPPPPPKVAAPAPPPPAPPAKEKLVLRGVNFDFNKSTIRPGDAAVLDEAAASLKANPNVTVNVNGYWCDLDLVLDLDLVFVFVFDLAPRRLRSRSRPRPRPRFPSFFASAAARSPTPRSSTCLTSGFRSS